MQRKNTSELSPVLFIHDVKTRWNSTYFMLERLKRIGPINVTEFTNQVKLEDISSEEWKVILILIKFLEPFYLVTKDLEGDKYPTISLAYPLIFTLMKKVNQFDVAGSPKMEQYKDIVLKQLADRFNQIGSRGKLATILDPRTKHLSAFGPKFKAECEQLLKEEVCKEKSKLDENKRDMESNVAETPSKKRKITSIMEEIVLPNTTPDEVQSYSSCEVTGYLTMKSIPLHDDPLLWWKQRSHLFPVLTVLVRKYLCVAATSAPSERLFSDGGNIVSDKRHLLDVELIRSLIFLHDNSDLLNKKQK